MWKQDGVKINLWKQNKAEVTRENKVDVTHRNKTKPN